MKSAILIAILLSLAAPVAHAGFAAADDDSSTDARANVVEACFGGCEKDNNQVNFTTSPYQVDKDWNTIMKDRGVIKPQDLENGEGKKERTWDL
jgi:hypothetical protein